jgi:hypothetical protein
MQQEFKEELKVTGEEIVKTVKKLIKEGNARRIIIKNEKGNSVMEFPVTVGAVGAVLLPTLAAVGTLAAILTKCTIVVVKTKPVKDN